MPTVIYPPYLRPQGYPFTTPRGYKIPDADSSKWLKVDLTSTYASETDNQLIEDWLKQVLAGEIGQPLAEQAIGALQQMENYQSFLTAVKNGVSSRDQPTEETAS